ncbi:hypothetical protein FGE12_22720 [Aggregicoccus sp. 17bor-14]|uniref:hypothetical protein n=1 Tax=Myxococcaceae TaxID=31 RepID=UPI00129D0002|nr:MULTISPECIES: hypothetical protein [Myxococcaceae]MBF5045236.1 hypothetical protein [Simulacricoccus sp. 17bor-14]MRI90977.1 hypothetical protein [Aggregicoccus sp. 17bor-14]
MDARFFAYDPRRTRLLLFLGACALAVLCAASLAAARAGGGRPALVRAGLSAGLLLLFLLARFRLRPRAGWGVVLATRGVSVARPFAAEPVALAWGQIARVRRTGRRGGVLALWLQGEGAEGAGSVRVSRQLFADAAHFEALAQALEERVPTPAYDA